MNKRITPLLLLTFPLLIQIPYALLMARFDYPQILREPASVILIRYTMAGPTLPLLWFSFAMAIVPLLLAIAALPSSIPQLPKWATPIGVASALAQFLGLLRWSFVVPLLAAERCKAPEEETRLLIDWIFTVQHAVLGTMVGEFAGQLLLALWTAAVAISVQRFRALGLLSAGLFVLSAFGALGTTVALLAPLETAGTAAFLLWSAWCALLGWQLGEFPSIFRRRTAEPAPEVAMQHARL